MEGPSWDSISLGFRELFRIFVPGAYAFGVARYFTAQPHWLFGTTGGVLGSVFFLGLIAYAFHVHENIWPYKKHFRTHTDKLNAAVALAASLKAEGQHKNFYKYFLESRVPSSLRERIHYFSSFYYMLAELSFLSVMGFLITVGFIVFVRAHPRSDWIVALLLGLAAFFFGRLGYSQWEAIIEQQLVLVRDLEKDLQELGGKWQPRSTS